jgi:ubiquinone/menaquinone biosynthesis C-methylase UbiE
MDSIGPSHEFREFRKNKQLMKRQAVRDISDPYTQFFYFSRYRAFVSALKQCRMFPLKSKKICEIGCGSGQILTDMVNWGIHAKDVAGIDINIDRISDAKKKLPYSLIAHANAQQVPFTDESFDIVYQATVFTSILDQVNREKAAHEMVRIVKKSGILLWYDFRYDNPWNSQVAGVSKNEIRKLFPKSKIALFPVTLLPQLGRVLVPLCWGAAWYMEKLPMLCTHYLAIIKPPLSRIT